jgi:CPA2 family monovalent cation:H+ antiporter-2
MRAGMLAQRLKLSPLVGYLLAGVIVGPFTPGFVADQTLATAAGRDRRDPADVRRGPAFLAGDLLDGEGDRRARRAAADRLRHRAGLGLAWAGLGAMGGGWCSGWRCRWPAPWCCCARWKSAACWKPGAAASRWAG